MPLIKHFLLLLLSSKSSDRADSPPKQPSQRPHQVRVLVCVCIRAHVRACVYMGVWVWVHIGVWVWCVSETSGGRCATQLDVACNQRSKKFW